MVRNGFVPAGDLVVVDAHGTRLARSTAAMWGRLQADAAKAGHAIWITITAGAPEGGAIGGYRDDAVQEWLITHPIGPAKIAPRDQSTHGLGTALDISGDAAANAWLNKNAARYGIRRTIASESWHWQHDGVTLASSSSSPLNNTTQPKEEDMAKELAFHRIADGEGAGGIYSQSEPGAPMLPLSGPEWAAYATQGNKYVDHPATEFQALIRRLGVINLDAKGHPTKAADGSLSVYFG